MAFICLVLACLSPFVSAMKQPSEYGANQCELVAKDFQKEFGGSLVFIQPLKSNGDYDLCDYCGHWINKKYISGNKKEFYFDWQHQKIFNSKEEIKSLFHDNLSIDVEIFDLSKEYPPFAINWHY
jgi:hypothetical protein